MTTYNLNGIEFNTAEGEPGDFGMFTHGDVRATDTAPWGMVEEMKAFIRVQDERKLRKLVDVGALWGVFSLVFTRYEDAKALAIEPSPWAWDGLVDNVKANPGRNIHPLMAFCGEQTGSRINCGKEWRHLIAKRPGDGPEVYPATVVALDDIPGAQDCDCIKIDVEGFEGPVLRGAWNLIQRQKPIIFLEAHFSVLREVSGDSNETLFELIRDLGYAPFNFQGEKIATFAGVNGHRYILEPEP